MAFQNRLSAGSTRKGAETRARIVDAATALFATHGFEATTFAMISDVSGAATGSIVHCFHDKATLAEIIYATAMGRLVKAIGRAFDRNPTDVAGTVQAAISACFSWANAHPEGETLLRVLHEYAGPNETACKRAHLEPLIATWAQPLIRSGLLQPLEPAQLYAVMMAPALCGAAASVTLLTEDQKPTVAWISLLSTAALAAVLPQNPRSRVTKAIVGNVGDSTMVRANPASLLQGNLI